MLHMMYLGLCETSLNKVRLKPPPPKKISNVQWRWNGTWFQTRPDSNFVKKRSKPKVLETQRIGLRTELASP
jgi:hypothetical protein